MRASRAALNMPTVSGVFGQWMVTKSALGSAASRSVTGSQPAALIPAAGLHLHGLTALGGARADASEPDDQHGLVVEIDRDRRHALVPLVGLHHGIELGPALGERHHHEHGLLGHRRRVGGAGDHQRDLPLRQRRHVDRVVAHADARHHQHLTGGLDLGSAERRHAQRHAVDGSVLRQQGAKVCRRDRTRELHRLDVAALLEQVPADLGHRLRDQQLLLVRRHFHPLRMMPERAELHARMGLAHAPGTRYSLDAAQPCAQRGFMRP
jgi:hypothetical protein